ncbi:MAG: cardiolipin synthase [Planctomycetota bacterium]
MKDPFLLISGWGYAAAVVVLLVTVFYRKREPAEKLAWSLAIVFLPFLGALLFVVFGLASVPRRVRRRVERVGGFRASVSFRPGAAAGGAVGYPEGTWRGILGKALEAMGEGPRREGNATKLYTRGLPVATDVEKAVEAAKHHVHIEFYIFRDDRLGRRFVDLLIRKLGEGVQVRVIVDGIGSYAGWKLLKKLRAAGGKAASFRPLFSVEHLSPNFRNHRKIVISDGRVAFFGGMNVGEEYLGREGAVRCEWYDLHMRVEGPAVWDLQRIFLEDWSFATREHLDDPAFSPELEAAGDSPVQIIAGGPDVDVNPIRFACLRAFSQARRRLLVASPYIVPDMSLRDALAAAALSGVEVDIVTQGYPPDHVLPYACTLYFAEELLESGVRFHSYRPGMMHAKAISVDGEWAMVGTANLDNRSMFLNFEQMAILDGPRDVEAIDEQFRRLIQASDPIRLEGLRSRSAFERFFVASAHLLAPLL